MADNSTGQSGTGMSPREGMAALFPIAGKAIAELCGENKNLLIFLHSIEAPGDMIGGPSIVSIFNTDDPDRTRITTGSVMGFIGVDNLRIKIKSRFDKGRDDYLLHYVLQKVLLFNLFGLSHNNEEEDVFDFIMLMFPYFLKAAM